MLKGEATGNIKKYIEQNDFEIVTGGGRTTPLPKALAGEGGGQIKKHNNLIK